MRAALKVAAALALVLLILLLAQESAAMTLVAVAGLAVGGLLWLWLRRPDAAAGVTSLAITMAITSEILFWIAGRAQSYSPSQLGLVFWIFAFVVAVTTWLAPRHRGGKALTIVMAHGVLVASSLVTYLAPGVVPIVGFVVSLAIVLWRSRRPRWKIFPYGKKPGDESRGAGKTADLLTTVGEDFTVFGPQGKIEQLVKGPDRFFVVATRQWGGTVGLVETDRGQAYGLDGDPNALTTRLSPILEQVRWVKGRQGGVVDGIVVFWDDTKVPGKGVTVDVLGGRQPVRIILTRGDRLTRVLRSGPG